MALPMHSVGMRDRVGALSDYLSTGRKNSFDCSTVFVTGIVVPDVWEAGIGRDVFPQKSLKGWFAGSIECSAQMKPWAFLYFLGLPGGNAGEWDCHSDVQ